MEYPEVMALLVSHGIVRNDRTLDVLQVYEQIRPHLVASSIEMSVEEVRDDVAYVKFATGCSAPDQQAKDEIMGSSASGFLACARCWRWPQNLVGVRRHRQHRDRPAVTHAYAAHGTASRPVRRLGRHRRAGWPCRRESHAVACTPRAGWTDGQRIVVADSGNHRVMIWHTFPDVDGAPADVVLGQPDFTSEGPAAGSADTRRGLYLPTGVAVVDGDLVVADAWHHRLLVFDGIRTQPSRNP